MKLIQVVAATVAAMASTTYAGSCATMYEHVNYVGGQYHVNNDVSWIGGGWNDKVSSVRVNSGKILTIYQHINYGGRSWQIRGPANVPNFVPLGWNDQLSSMKCGALVNPNGPYGTIYEHNNYGGLAWPLAGNLNFVEVIKIINLVQLKLNLV